MDEFEKVEKLRERANVSYEEAKTALNEANGDILDAMILLENQGKTIREETQTHSTTYEEQKNYISVAKTVENQEQENQRTMGQKFKHLLCLIFKKLKENDFVAEKDGKEIARIPIWAMILILLFFTWAPVVILIIGLFLSCRYTISGPDDAKVINDVMGKASDMADKVKDEFEKL